MASALLSQTISSSTGKIFTMSVWIKKSANDSINQILHLSSDSNTHKYIDFATKSTRGIDFQLKNGSGGTYIRRRTTRVFRDFSAWYHIVIRFDSTESTAGDRLRIYVNGEQATDIDVDSTPDVPLNMVSDFNTNGGTLNIGKNIGTGFSSNFDGEMAHFHLTDGYSYAPTTFGETDTTTGIWKPKTSPSVTYGTNGFFLKFDNSGNMGLDSSGQSNSFTTTGTIIQQKDTPSNVYATGNPLIKGTNGNSNVNNTSTSGQNSWETLFGTFGVTSGKWYAEFKMISNNVEIGIVDIEQAQTFDIYPGSLSRGFGYRANGDVYKGGSGQSGTFASYTAGDIIGVAMDMTNNKLYLSKNGTFQNSGDPTSGASGTGALSIDSGYTYTFAFGAYNGSVSANFGNGYFGTTAITSAGSNGNGSLFEFDVPTGYYALNTKNLGTQS